MHRTAAGSPCAAVWRRYSRPATQRQGSACTARRRRRCGRIMFWLTPVVLQTRLRLSEKPSHVPLAVIDWQRTQDAGARRPDPRRSRGPGPPPHGPQPAKNDRHPRPPSGREVSCPAAPPCQVRPTTQGGSEDEQQRSRGFCGRGRGEEEARGEWAYIQVRRQAKGADCVTPVMKGGRVGVGRRLGGSRSPRMGPVTLTDRGEHNLG